MNACGSKINNHRLESRHVCIRAVGRSTLTFRRKTEMNEDDLLKCGRAAALPNGAEAGLVSHAFCRRYRFSSPDLLVRKREEIFRPVFEIPPEYCEGPSEDELTAFLSKAEENKMKGTMKC